MKTLQNGGKETVYRKASIKKVYRYEGGKETLQEETLKEEGKETL